MMKIKDVLLGVLSGVWGNELTENEIGTPVIKTNNLTYEGYISFDNLVFRSIPSKKLSSHYLMQGDLLVEKSGGTKTHSVGYVNIFEGESYKYTFNNFIITLRPNQNIVLPKYLFYQMRRMYEIGIFSDCYNKTTGIQNLQNDIYLSKELNVRNVVKQSAIVNELDMIEKEISIKRNSLCDFDELIKSRFIELFEQNDYPLERIDEVCELKSGTTFDKDFEKSSGELLYCKVSDMNLEGNEKYMLISKTYVDRAIGIKCSLPKGTVIFPKRGGAIGTNKKRIIIKDTCVDLNIMGVIPGAKINTQYLFQYFQNIDMGTLCDGSTVPQLNNKNIGPLLIKVPPMNVQNEFADFVIQIDKSKFIVQKQIEDLQELLNKKMDEYFGNEEDI